MVARVLMATHECLPYVHYNPPLMEMDGKSPVPLLICVAVACSSVDWWFVATVQFYCISPARSEILNGGLKAVIHIYIAETNIFCKN
jgi:hypothetical protein